MHSDDTSCLKTTVAEWINMHDESEERLSSYGKEECGIGNDITGHLICPIDYNWDDLE
jgi:hypothetical protein